MKTKINSNILILYLVLIPFLHPKGFESISSGYDKIFTLWLYIAVAVIAIYFLYLVVGQREEYPNCIYCMLLYYVIMIGITFISLGGFNVGMQKMFAAPALCIMSAILIKKDAVEYINCISNLLLIVLGLNVLVFNPLFFGQYFSAKTGVHLLFIGHVQIASQMGILGVLCAYLLSIIYKKWNAKARFLILFSIITLIISETVASYASLGILVAGYIYMRITKRGKLLDLKATTYIVFYLVINCGLLVWLYYNDWRFNLWGLSINGRSFIWEQVFYKFLEKPVFGYGVYGVYFIVFWHYIRGNTVGMNYAHSQLCQLLLDGGLILLFFFLLFLFSYVARMKQIRTKKLRMFGNLVLIILLFIMIFESTFEYFYVLFSLSLLAFLPEIESQIERGR